IPIFYINAYYPGGDQKVSSYISINFAEVLEGKIRLQFDEIEIKDDKQTYLNLEEIKSSLLFDMEEVWTEWKVRYVLIQGGIEDIQAYDLQGFGYDEVTETFDIPK